MQVYSDAELDSAARTIFGEARGEPTAGQMAVAWVIRNRVEQPSWWGKTPDEVCTHPYQFSCWNANDPNSSLLKLMSSHNLRYQWFLGVVKVVFKSQGTDPTGGATHYKVRGTKASWDSEVEQKGIAPVSIGKHDFFKIGPH